MPLPALIVPILMSVAAAEEPPITVRGFPWAPFISPMGEPFRPPSSGEAPIARWFAGADRNQDGVLTADEMRADADRFFARLDANHDGQIDPDERRTYEFEIAPEIQVNSDWRRIRGQPRKRTQDQHDGYHHQCDSRDDEGEDAGPHHHEAAYPRCDLHEPAVVVVCAPGCSHLPHSSCFGG